MVCIGVPLIKLKRQFPGGGGSGIGLWQGGSGWVDLGIIGSEIFPRDVAKIQMLFTV